MRYPQDFINDITHQVSEYVYKFKEVTPEDLGLDRRSGYRLYLHPGGDCIVVPKRDDRNLQYYGGFEYVDKDCRTEVGDFVFYFSEDERVQEHLNCYFDEHEEEEESFLERDDDNALMEDF